MPANYPTNKDTFVDPVESDTLQTANHFNMHKKIHVSLGAIQDKVGTDNSEDTNSIDYKISNLEGKMPTGTVVGTTDTQTLSNKTLTQEDWIVVGEAGGPAFQNDWSHYADGAWGKVSFMKDSNGFVHLKGLIGKAAPLPNSSVLFTLPVGYRPVTTHDYTGAIFPVQTGDTTTSRVDFRKNGDVFRMLGNNASNVDWMSLWGISFRAEA